MADKSQYITRSGRITKRTLLNDSLRLGEKKKIKRAFEMNEARQAEFERRLGELENSRAQLQLQNDELRNTRTAENQQHQLEIQQLRQELQAARNGESSGQNNQPQNVHAQAQANQQIPTGNVNATEVCNIIGSITSSQ